MSVPTVSSLCASLGHHLAPAPGFTAPETEVTAVHISELDDPNPYLSGGELLMTTGLVLPTSTLGAQRYVARLLEARISALAFGVGPVHQEVPEPLVAACRTAGLALLVVPEPTPFTLISRTYWSALSRATEEQLTDAVAAHRAMVDAAVSPDPRPAILRRLAGVLGGWAALLDAVGEVAEVAESSPPTAGVELDALRVEVARLEVAGAHSSVSFTLGDHVVVVFPLTVQDRIVGYLATGSPRRLDQAQRRVVLTAAALLSLDATRNQRAESAAEATRRCVALLVDAGQVEAARQLAARTGSPVPDREVCVLALRGRDGADLVRTVVRWCPDALAVRGDDASAWLCLPTDHPELEQLAAYLRNVDPGMVAVLTEPVAAERVGSVRVRAQRSLATLAPGTVVAPMRKPAAHDVVRAVDGFVEQAPAEVVAALVGYLRCRGQWEQAARTLGVHRNTLRYRVARAREALALDLDDPDIAAETWLALRARGVA